MTENHKKLPEPPSAGEFDNWKDFAEAGMAWIVREQETQTLDELLRRAKTEDDGLLWKSIAKKGDRKRGAPVLLAALKKFSGDEEGNDAMRFYALEAIFDLFRLAQRPSEDPLFLELFTRSGGVEQWHKAFEDLSTRVRKKSVG